MSYSSLESKTIRPGSLGSYSYYHSAPRRPVSLSYPTTTISLKQKSYAKRLGVALAVVLTLLILPLTKSYPSAKSSASAAAIRPTSTPSAPAITSQPNQCGSSSSSKAIIVSISQQHLWACADHQAVNNSAVVTGMSQYPDTVTPTGTFYIYAKETNLTLSGSDSAGSWSDPVKYWMPFLNNQYGTYGLHDATWRSVDQFGHINPSSSKASNGCVELPLGSAQWLYNWASVGTAVTIKS